MSTNRDLRIIVENVNSKGVSWLDYIINRGLQTACEESCRKLANYLINVVLAKLAKLPVN